MTKTEVLESIAAALDVYPGESLDIWSCAFTAIDEHPRLLGGVSGNLAPEVLPYFMRETAEQAERNLHLGVRSKSPEEALKYYGTPPDDATIH